MRVRRTGRDLSGQVLHDLPLPEMRRRHRRSGRSSATTATPTTATAARRLHSARSAATASRPRGEQCDDGNTIDVRRLLRASCLDEGCGNGVRRVRRGVRRRRAGSATCAAGCKFIAPPACDGTPGVQCCGNGIVDSGEQCDDGNANDCDGCSHLCQFRGCGDGTVEDDCHEQCDD